MTPEATSRPLCECGCGERVNVAKHNYPKRGIQKGDPFRFLRGHHLRGRNHHSWNGGRTSSGSYVRVLSKGHPRATRNGYVYEHVLIAEEALGGHLPERAEVHHVNGDGHDNRRENLVICEDHAYHMLLEVRTRALKACGHADWFKCTHCKQWGPPDEMMPEGEAEKHYHPACQRQYDRQRERNRGGAP